MGFMVLSGCLCLQKLEILKDFYIEEKERNGNSTTISVDAIVTALGNQHHFNYYKACLMFIKEFGLQFVYLSKFLQEKNVPVAPFALARILQFRSFLHNNHQTQDFGAEIHTFINQRNLNG